MQETIIDNAEPNEELRLQLILEDARKQMDLHNNTRVRASFKGNFRSFGYISLSREYDHAINTAMARFGVSGYAERRRIGFKLREIIDLLYENDQNQQERAENWGFDMLFGPENIREYVVGARERMNQYPDISEFLTKSW